MPLPAQTELAVTVSGTKVYTWRTCTYTDWDFDLKRDWFEFSWQLTPPNFHKSSMLYPETHRGLCSGRLQTIPERFIYSLLVRPPWLDRSTVICFLAPHAQGDIKPCYLQELMLSAHYMLKYQDTVIDLAVLFMQFVPLLMLGKLPFQNFPSSCSRK